MREKNEIQTAVDIFMRKIGVHESTVNFTECVDSFQNDMKAGLAGKAQSLLMIPSYIQADVPLPKERNVLAIDAGGSNLRVACVHFYATGEAKIERFEKYPMPGSRGALSKQHFFDILVTCLEPMLQFSRDLGICFSFPCEILPDHDGKILGFNKEVVVDGVEGAILGREFNAALQRRSLPQVAISVINDTVATMLGAIVEYANEKYDGYIGYILGTGTNACYKEKTANIYKLTHPYNADNMIINMESGGFNGFRRSWIDMKLDAASNNPGDHQYEKMVSGAYLGQQVLQCMLEIAEGGLYTNTSIKMIRQCREIPLQDVDSFMQNTNEESILSEMSITQEDRWITSHIIETIYSRAAKMVAVTLAAVLRQMQSGTNINHPVCISIDGSTYQKSVIMQNKLDFFVEKELNPRGLYCEFIKPKDSTIIGAALAAVHE